MTLSAGFQRFGPTHRAAGKNEVRKRSDEFLPEKTRIFWTRPPNPNEEYYDFRVSEQYARTASQPCCVKMSQLCGLRTERMHLVLAVGVQSVVVLMLFINSGYDRRLEHPRELDSGSPHDRNTAQTEPFVTETPAPKSQRPRELGSDSPKTRTPGEAKPFAAEIPAPQAQYQRKRESDSPNNTSLAQNKPVVSKSHTQKTHPVRYVLYDSDYGQMGNQRFALVNALLIAETLNATLVLPSSRNMYLSLPAPRAMTFRHGDRQVKKNKVPHNLIGWYYDYYRSSPRIMFENEFLETENYMKLATRVLPMTSTGYSRNLKFRIEPETNETMLQRRTCLEKRGHCIPERYCRDEESYRRGSFDTDALLLGRMYSPVNCTSEAKEWLEINHALRPRPNFEKPVQKFFSSIERPAVAIHVRLLNRLEERAVISGTGASSFVQMINKEHKATLRTARSIYVAHMRGIATEKVAKQLIRFCKKFKKNVYTVDDILVDDKMRSRYSFPYSVPMLDMTALSRADLLIGRQKSTFSMTAMYLREAIGNADEDTQFYSGVVFRHDQSNTSRSFSCPYYDHRKNLKDPSCRDM